jgi:hypothetical protein
VILHQDRCLRQQHGLRKILWKGSSVSRCIVLTRREFKRMIEVELSLLLPDNLPDVVKKLGVGSRLLIHEGRKVVAEGKVLSLRTIEGKSVLSYKEIESLRPPTTSANS